MGYYTYFELKVDTEWTEEITQSIKGHDRLNQILDEYTGKAVDSYKWYSHEEDMREFSKSHPNILFTLHGEGEEAGDMWYKYFKNGKMQICPAIITFDPYDPNKLT